MQNSVRALATAATAALFLGVITAPAWAAPPKAPELVSPGNGTTASARDLTLSVKAADPDGGQLDVRFEGRKAGAAKDSAPFTLVSIPDTQAYTYSGHQASMVRQTQWIVDSRARLNTAMVVGLGDLVETYTRDTQWSYADASQKVLDDAGIPNSVVAGNHDFNVTTGEFAQYDARFPPSRYAGKKWSPSTASYGGYLGQNLFGTDPVDRKNMNNFVLFSAGGTDFLVLNLEWEAPSYALEWGAKVLAAHPNRVAILATHSFLQVYGGRNLNPQRVGGTSQTKLWTDFVAKQCSIKLVLSGHAHDGDNGESNRTDKNQCGQPVTQVLTDYQSRANGGDGWLRYYTFNPATKTVAATTYSPTLDRYETDANSAFTFDFDFASTTTPFTTIGTAKVSSGGTASATWKGLDPDTLYEWRAVASDGTTTTTSPTWTVKTPAASGALVDDSFSRTLTGSWGSADGTHAWTLKGTAQNYSVNGSAGRVTVPPGSTRGGSLTGLSTSDARVTTDLTLDQAAGGSGTYVTIPARVTSAGSYRAKLRYVPGGGLQLSLARHTGSETNLATATLSGVTVSPGQAIRIVFELEGTAPTKLRAKAWPLNRTEPATWTVSTTDATTTLQAPGTAGIELYTSGSSTATSTFGIDRFTVSPLGITPPENARPTAVISTPSIDNLKVSLSGTGSSDPDGFISAYSWDFGDGTTGTGATTSHTYTTAGTYRISLTVTDNQGATDTTTKQITLTAPVTGVLAADSFGRTTSNGWGSAETGGEWTLSGGSTRYGVSGGVGKHILTTPGSSTYAALADVKSTATDLRTTVAWDRTAASGTLYASFVSRRVSATSDYRCNIVVSSTGAMTLSLLRRANSAETTLASTRVPGTSQAANQKYRVACRTSATGGTTQLSAKLWKAGDSEPTGWQVSSSDSTPALQAAGGIGITTYMSSSAKANVTTSIDDLLAVDPRA